eukprot:m51a1_g11787 hypothetical protein (205) ;mRNA; f:300027-300641
MRTPKSAVVAVLLLALCTSALATSAVAPVRDDIEARAETAQGDGDDGAHWWSDISMGSIDPEDLMQAVVLALLVCLCVLALSCACCVAGCVFCCCAGASASGHRCACQRSGYVVMPAGAAAARTPGAVEAGQGVPVPIPAVRWVPYPPPCGPVPPQWPAQAPYGVLPPPPPPPPPMQMQMQTNNNAPKAKDEESMPLLGSQANN